jgi:outer membrane immunogenic protein
MIAGSSHAFAQSASSASSDAILKRLDALEKENRALRDRVQHLEAGKRNTASVTASTATPVIAPVSPAPSGTSAMAMATKAPISPASAPYNWTGFYVGGHLGGGISRNQWSDPLASPSDQGSHNATGVLGGMQAGYNWQMGQLVLGVEGQYSFADLKGDHENAFTLGITSDGVAALLTGASRYSTKISGIATIAGRVGFVSDAIDRTLFFAKGGAAYARGQFGQQSSFAEIICAPDCNALGITASLGGDANHWGWMVGAGLEYGLTQNWSAKIEYNYLDFGTKTVSLAGSECISNGVTSVCQPLRSDLDIRQNIQTVTVGINYRFIPGNY